MECSKCGTENKEGDKFCKSCGASLEFGKVEGIEYIRSKMAEREERVHTIKGQELGGSIILVIGIILYIIGFFASISLPTPDYTNPESLQTYYNIMRGIYAILFFAPVFCFTGIGLMIVKFYEDWKESL